MPSSPSRGIGSLIAVTEELNRDGRGWILVVVAAGWFLSLGTRLIFPAILPHLRSAFDFDLATAGLLLTVLWIAYALGQLPGGMLGDRIGERNVLAVSTGATAVTVLLLSLADTAWMLFGGVVIFGIITALYGTTRLTVLADVYPNRAGMAIGLTSAAGNIGNSVLPFVGGILAASISWRIGLGITVPLFLLVASGLWLVVPPRTSQSTSAVDQLSVETVRTVIGSITERSVLTVATITVLLFLMWQGFTGFYPTYLIEIKGLSADMALLLFGLFFAVGTIVEPIAGACKDWFGTKRSLGVIISFQILSLGILPFAEGLPALVIVTVLLTSILGTTSITLSHLALTLPADVQGSGLGLIRTIYMIIGATGPVLVGFMADIGLFDEAFHVLALVAVGSLLLTIIVPSDG